MSPEPSTNRRNLLRTTAALLGVAASGGMAGCLGGNSNSDSESNPLFEDGGNGRADYIPSTASGVGYVNVNAFLADSELRAGINDTVSTFASQAGGFSGPQTVGGWLDEIESDSGYDPRKINEVLGYYTDSGGSSAEDGAAVVWTDWSESTITAAFEENGSNFTEETYSGKTLYQPEYGGPLAVLSDGTYAVGSGDAVRNVIDVSTGEGSALSGSLASIYEQTQGMARFAATVPSDTFDSAQSSQFNAAALDSVTHASSSLYQDGSQRGMDITLVTNSSQDADALETALAGGKQLALDQIQQRQSQMSGSQSQAADLYFESATTYLENSSISKNGSTVTIGYSAPPTEFVRNSPILFVFAGVFINTAGFLQSRAEETGQHSSDQVTDRLQPISVVGTDIQNGSIGTVEIVVKKAPGAADISLNDTVLQWVGPNGVADVVSAAAGSGGRNTFAVTSVRDDDSSIRNQQVLNDPADRARISLDIGDRDTVPNASSGSTMALSEGDTATIQMVTRSGGETELRLVVPESLRGTDAVQL